MGSLLESHKGRTIRKVIGGGGGRGMFEPQECFSLSNSLYEFFLGHSMNIFRINWRQCMNFFSCNFPLREYFFCTSLAPSSYVF